MGRCRLCLVVDSTLENLSGNVELYDRIASVFPKMDLSLVKNPKLCSICLRRIHYSYNFRQCVYIAEKKIRSQLLEIDLDKVNIIRSLQRKCRLCIKDKPSVDLSPIFKINGFSERLIRSMIKESLTSLDYNLFENPLICNTCWIIINQICTFKKDYYENERRLKLYSQKINKTCLDESDVELMIWTNCDIKEEPLTDCVTNNQIEGDYDTFDDGRLGKILKKEPDESENIDEETDDVFIEEPFQKNAPSDDPVKVKNDCGQPEKSLSMSQKLIQEAPSELSNQLQPTDIIELVPSEPPNQVISEELAEHIACEPPIKILPEKLVDLTSSNQPELIRQKDSLNLPDNIPQVLIEEENSTLSDKIPPEELLEQPEKDLSEEIPSNESDTILPELISEENSSDLANEIISVEPAEEISSDNPDEVPVEELIVQETSSNQVQIANEPSGGDKVFPVELIEDKSSPDLPHDVLPKELTEHQNAPQGLDKIPPEYVEQEGSDVPDKITPKELVEATISSPHPVDKVLTELMDPEISPDVPDKINPEELMEHESCSDKILSELIEQEDSADVPEKISPEELMEHKSSPCPPHKVPSEELIEQEDSTEKTDKIFMMQSSNEITEILSESIESESNCNNMTNQDKENNNELEVNENKDLEKLKKAKSKRKAKRKKRSKQEHHACKHCNYTTAHLQHFKRHMLLHKNKKSLKMFKCPHCPYETYRKDHLKTHCLTHGKDDEISKMYTCDICEYATNRRYSLKRHHMQVHDKNVLKIFKCSKCSYVGKRKTDLDSHMKSHNKKMDFECMDCGYKAIRKSSLKTHMLKHQTIKPYECGKCGYRTNRKEHLKLHITNVQCKPKVEKVE